VFYIRKDEMRVNDPRHSQRTAPAGYVHQDCMLWVPAGLDVNLMDEGGVAGKICPTLQ
jgi:hypothetical protein